MLPPGASRLAHAFWPRAYRLLGLTEPLILPVWRRFGMGNVVRVTIPGRRTGRPRSVLLGLLRADGNLYLGHPDVPCAWTRNLRAAGGAVIEYHDGTTVPFHARPLEPGPERDGAIAATFRDHVFPGNVLYWLFRRHLAAAGTFFRVELASEV